MNKTPTQKQLLYKLGIRHFDNLIHDQPKEWLIKYFSKGADEYPINVSLLMRNIVWQMRQRIQRKQKPLLNELIRTFWYMYIKPTLSRVDALSEKTDQYDQLIDTIVSMVKDWHILEYKDIGFRDDKQAYRSVGFNANIILFAEKLGHQNFLENMADKFDISTLALGGQPSVMNIEYFVDDLKKHGTNLRKTFHLFSIVDYDPSGWIIRDAFINNLNHYKIKNIKCIDLINPDMLTPEETTASRYTVPTSGIMQRKNATWLKEIKKRNYKNQHYLDPIKNRNGKEKIYGLESEAISTKRLETKLDTLIPKLLTKNKDMLRILELHKINESVKELMLLKLQ